MNGRRWIIGGIAALLYLFLAAPTKAAEVHGHVVVQCFPRLAMLQTLSHYGETPKHIGLASDGSVFEVLISKTGSWTIIRTTPQGESCALAVGENWQDLNKSGERS